jgi:hypothetical protein
MWGRQDRGESGCILIATWHEDLAGRKWLLTA